MEWYKHLTASLNDPDISDAEDEFGDAGYTVFFKTLEVYGQEYNHLNSDKKLRISRRYFARKLRKSWTKVEKVLNFYQERQRIFIENDSEDNNMILVKIPKFIELASNWTKRSEATPTEAPTEAPHAIEVEEEVEEEKDSVDPGKPDDDVISVEDETGEKTDYDTRGKWDDIIQIYEEHLKFTPSWTTGNGKAHELHALNDALDKIICAGGERKHLLEVIKLFLQEKDEYIVKNGHRPSLMKKRIDYYIKQLKAKKRTHKSETPGYVIQ